jgi:hypothetical protein
MACGARRAQLHRAAGVIAENLATVLVNLWDLWENGVCHRRDVQAGLDGWKTSERNRLSTVERNGDAAYR